MSVLVVVSDPADWPLQLEGVEVTTAREYLTEARFAEEPRRKVFNLCRSYRYQHNGYYVSLLAEARGHRPQPSIATIQDLKSTTVLRHAADEIDDTLQKSLSPIQADDFELSVYFGRNVSQRHNDLASALFRLFQAPLMRASFARSAAGPWKLTSLNAIAWSEIPEHHREFVVGMAREYFAGRLPRPRRRRARARFDLAILRDPSDPEPASDARAMRRFVHAGEAVGFAVEVIDRHAFARLAEFDALFIRDTTSVNHYTYRFSRKAKAEGMVVVDDPESILRCLNKVYLAELMQRNKVPTPRTVIVHRANADRVEALLGLPCVLKQPDSAFSAGVVKAETPAELRRQLDRLFERSTLIVAQEFCPTPFDWRVGVLDGQPLYACRYYMARRHWQIIKRDAESGTKLEGKWDTLEVEEVPAPVLRAAVKAAGLYGDALYGVDLKEREDGGVYVIEVNENPSIDAGVEDAVLGDELYLRIMRYLIGRVERRKLIGAEA